MDSDYSGNPESALDVVRKIREQFARESGGDLRRHVQQTKAATKGLREQLEIIQARKRRGSREKFGRALAQAPDVPPMPGDDR